MVNGYLILRINYTKVTAAVLHFRINVVNLVKDITYCTIDIALTAASNQMFVFALRVPIRPHYIVLLYKTRN